jgi:hypothetical protein
MMNTQINQTLHNQLHTHFLIFLMRKTFQKYISNRQHSPLIHYRMLICYKLFQQMNYTFRKQLMHLYIIYLFMHHYNKRLFQKQSQINHQLLTSRSNHSLKASWYLQKSLQLLITYCIISVQFQIKTSNLFS